MPRNVRNFWIELDVDGKKTRVATGPVSKTGGFCLRVYQRDAGGVMKSMEMEGTAGPDGGLYLMATDGKSIIRKVTER